MDSLLESLHEQHSAFQALVLQPKVVGLSDDIDPNHPPRSYAEAMRRKDAAEWKEAFTKEAQGFIDRGSLVQKRPPPGAKILNTTTVLEYKIDNGSVFLKRKARLCARGDQQKPHAHFQPDDLYTPVLKATELKLLTAIAAQEGLPIYKTDTKQAFLYGELEEELYIYPPDWWPEPFEPGNALLLKNSIYGLKQAARCWHTRVSTWMIENDYLPVNEEKTIFRKQEGSDYIIHGLYVDDIKSVPSCPRLMKEFDEKYALEFESTESTLVETYLGLQMEQLPGRIDLHLDNYVQELLSDYKQWIKKPLGLRRIPMQPGIVLSGDDVPDSPPDDQSTY